MAAALSRLLAVVTPVAAQPFPPAGLTVHREGHIAVGTEHRLAAAPAAQKGSVAPPRHQHHALFPPLRQLAQALQQGPTNQASVTLGQFMAHVHQAHRRQGAPGDPLRQLQQAGIRRGAPAAQPGLQGGGGAAKHQAGSLKASPMTRHIAGVIAGHGPVLFVGSVVFLIQHDQSEVGDRQKHRGPGSDRHQR